MRVFTVCATRGASLANGLLHNRIFATIKALFNQYVVVKLIEVVVVVGTL